MILPRNAPYRNAVWVGPEWVWRHGRYVAVPGHWERMRRQPEVFGFLVIGKEGGKDIYGFRAIGADNE